VTTDLTSGAEAIAISRNGKLVVAGETDDQKGRHFAVCRYNPDGSLDTSFGAAGKVVNNTTPGGANALALQSDGKIVIAGQAIPDPAKPGRLAVLRYNGDGSLDTSFGTGGIASTDLFATGFSTARGVAIQSDGKIVAAGSVQLSASIDSIDFALARLIRMGRSIPLLMAERCRLMIRWPRSTAIRSPWFIRSGRSLPISLATRTTRRR